MRRTIIAILSTALVLAGSTAIVNAAGGNAAGGPERQVAAASAAAEPSPAATEAKRIPSWLKNAQGKIKVRCRSLGCINRTLTKLAREVFKCEQLRNLTQYYGYVGFPGPTQYTALDYTRSGDPVSNAFVVHAC